MLKSCGSYSKPAEPDMILTIRCVNKRWHVLDRKFKTLSDHDTVREAEAWVVERETKKRKAKRS
jgi:predicted component of viral defense system (DUF524 family)